MAAGTGLDAKSVPRPLEEIMMRRSYPIGLAGITLALVLVAAACDTPTAVPDVHGTHIHTAAPADRANLQATVAQEDLLRAVRQATARFHSVPQAERRGYEQHSPCVEVPGMGAMGYHWVNVGLVDGHFDPLRPEALLYAPGPGEALQLVGVEYIVLNEGQDHPHFGDHPLDVGGTPDPRPHWSLHVWLYAENPNGMFAPFNPDVSCG
jgi:hypothetical protein